MPTTPSSLSPQASEKIDSDLDNMYYFSMAESLEIPQEILDSARMTMSELKIEVAVYLYSEGRLSVGKAHELADMSLWQFRQLLASRQIPVHFDEDDLTEDIETLQDLSRL